MKRKILEQGRAAYAYKCAEEGKALGASSSKEYKAYTKKIPMLIKTNGLGGALAFIRSKTKSDAYKTIYAQLSQWLQEECETTAFYFEEDKELVAAIINFPSPVYRAITVETLAYFNWLRRFAEGLISDEKKQEAETTKE